MPQPLPRAQVAQDLIDALDVRFFLALGEPARLEILKQLVVLGRSDVAGIAARLPQDRTVISRHLKQLEEAGILARSKEGRHVFYELDPAGFVGPLAHTLDQVKRAIAACCPD